MSRTVTVTHSKTVAFVTGAVQGIGLAAVVRLSRHGFRVVAMDRSVSALAAAVANMREQRLDAETACVDVCDRATVTDSLRAIHVLHCGPDNFC